MEKIKLSIEELAYALGVMGGQDVASGLLLAVLGKRSPDELNARLLAASHGLIAREYLDLDIAKRSKTLNPEVEALLTPLVSSKFSLRCSRVENGVETLLNFYFSADIIQYYAESDVVIEIAHLTNRDTVLEHAAIFFDLGQLDDAPPEIEEMKIAASIIEELKNQTNVLAPDEIELRLRQSGLSDRVAKELARAIKHASYRGSIIRVISESGQSISNEGFLILNNKEQPWFFEIVPSTPPGLKVLQGTKTSFTELLVKLMHDS